MPKRLSSKQIIKILEKNNFSFASQKGSHIKYKNSTGKTVIVPHPRKITPIGTTNSIIKQSGLTKKDFGL